MSKNIMLKIFPAKTNEDLKFIRILFQEYADFIKQMSPEYSTLSWFIDYQKSIEKELTNIPGKYAPPTGCILLSQYNGQPAGCVVLKKLSKNICKGKRLYVRPQFRGLKIGRKLMESLIAEARRIGYSSIQGDAIVSMKIAHILYASLGFKEIFPLYHKPVENIKTIELDLK